MELEDSFQSNQCHKLQNQLNQKKIKTIVKMKLRIYEIHRGIAIFGWRRIKDFWNNNQHCYYEHKEDEDLDVEIAE